MQLGEALRLAQSKGLDLIEIAPTATPPVCRIVQYGKFQYEESKKKASQTRQAANQMKEIQLTANIDPHDLQVKMNHAIDFLCEDMKVRVRLRFRGRQKAHKEFGFEVVNKFIRDTAAYGRPDALPKMAGDRDLHVIITSASCPARQTRLGEPGTGAPSPCGPSAGSVSNGLIPSTRARFRRSLDGPAIPGFIVVVLLDAQKGPRLPNSLLVGIRIESHLVFSAQGVVVFQAELAVGLIEDDGALHHLGIAERERTYGGAGFLTTNAATRWLPSATSSRVIPRVTRSQAATASW
jgi:translation initiation factor IF-3